MRRRPALQSSDVEYLPCRAGEGAASGSAPAAADAPTKPPLLGVADSPKSSSAAHRGIKSAIPQQVAFLEMARHAAGRAPDTATSVITGHRRASTGRASVRRPPRARRSPWRSRSARGELDRARSCSDERCMTWRSMRRGRRLANTRLKLASVRSTVILHDVGIDEREQPREVACTREARAKRATSASTSVAEAVRAWIHLLRRRSRDHDRCGFGPGRDGCVGAVGGIAGDGSDIFSRAVAVRS